MSLWKRFVRWYRRDRRYTYDGFEAVYRDGEDGVAVGEGAVAGKGGAGGVGRGGRGGDAFALGKGSRAVGGKGGDSA